MEQLLRISTYVITRIFKSFNWLRLSFLVSQFFIFQFTTAQNITTCGNSGGVNMVGSMQGYSQPINCAADYRVLTYRKVSTTAANPTDGRGQWKTTCNVQSSGGNFSPSNMTGGGGSGFLLTNGDVCGNTGQYTRKWVFPSNYQATLDGITAVNYYTSGGADMGLNMGTAGRYTVVLQDAGCSNSNYYVGYTLNTPVSLAFGLQVLNGDGSYTIQITTSAAPSAGENIYVRYRLTTNDFTAGTFIVQATGAGTNWSATIPTVATGTTVYYFPFSSTRSLASLNADNESNRSLSCLNFLDNSGNNYSYLQSVSLGPILVTGTTPASSTFYTSLTQAAGAFAAINSGAHQGTVTISILGDVITENGLTPLYQSGYLGASNYTSISIIPTGARTISGSAAVQLIDINGADFVTINGLNSGGNSLIIENTNTNATNGTIRLINDARNNTITNCTLKGSSIQSNSAIVYFSSADATLLQGNDNNTISNCILRESSGGDPVFGINSFGMNGGVAPAAQWNSNNVISNNQIINIYSPNTALCAAIQLTNGANTDWTITGNSIFWSTTKTSTLAAADYFYGIRITGGNGVNFNISNNFIGGTSANCGGTAMTVSNNTFGNKICAIDLNLATTGTASSVQGNTVANISLNTNSNKSTAPFVFSGIMVESGLVNIGTITGNTIGSSATFGSISIATAATAAAGAVCGIAIQGVSSTATLSNNQVSGFNLTNSSGTHALNFFGIKINAGTALVSSNTIGSTTLANSILNSTASASVDVLTTAGIQQVSGSTVSTISNNTIANFNNNTSCSNAFVWGIVTNSGSPSISGNTIRNLSNSGLGSLADATVGIYANTSETITQNTIYALSCPAATSNSDVTGIRTVGTGSPILSRNLIYAVSANNLTTNFAIGIKAISSNASFTNNMVSLGNGITNSCSFRAISIEGSGNFSVYFNSLVLTGASSATNGNSNALNIVSGTVIAKNNILYNDRTPLNTGSKCLAYVGTLTSDYNDFYFSLGNNIANTYTTLAAYQSGTGLETNSKNILPVFINIANDLHLASGNCTLYGAGTTIGGISIDFDNDTRKTPPDLGADENIGNGTLTWTGALSTDWNVAGNWCPPVVPIATSNVVIPSAPLNQPLISNANAVCNSLTINNGAAHIDMAASKTLTFSSGGSFSNNGAFNCGVINEEVIFLGNGTITGISASTFRNLTLNGTTTLLTIPTITATLKLNLGSNVTAPPNYGAFSTLVYNNSGIFNVVTEWTGSAITAGTGVPNHVTIQNNTTLNMPSGLRGMAGDLTILSGTLQMNGTSGADLNIGGNWTRSAASGVFNPNNRAISFKGSNNQLVTVTGGGIEKFNILIIDKPIAGTYLLPSAVAGNLTDITVNGTTNAVLQFINQGSLDLNGRTFRLDGNNAGAYQGYVYVNGPRIIYNSGGINNGAFAIMSSANPNQPNWYTRSIWNNFGTGTLTFNQDVLVTIADGRMDWGLDANGVNVTTIQGVLQINLGGSVVYNSCYYSSTPPSILRFSNTVDYQVNPGDKTWAFGAIYSGLPGIPYNVEVNNTNTDLTINEVRAVRNNITITDGRLTLNAGPFNVGGNWTRINPAGVTVPPCAFNPNFNKVVFDKTGAGDQTITCTVNSNTETFYDLDISPASVNVAFGGSTNVTVTNNLILTSGNVDLNGNLLTLGTTASAGSLTGGSTSSYILGYKGAVNGTFRRYTPNLSVAYLFPLGDISNYTPISITYNPGTTLNSAYTDGQLYAIANPQKGSATTYISRYWPVTPSGVSTPDYNAVYTYADADVVGTESALFPYKYNTYGWVGSGGSGAFFMQGTGSVNTGTNTLSWNNIASFSEFTGLSDGTPLPINLISFKAKLSEADAQIDWVTLTEKNNDYFTLERSWDGFNYEPINIQKGAGNSSFTISYSYLDIGVAKSNHSKAYYRLKQTDFNGAYSYSTTCVLSFNNATKVKLTAAPNPFENILELTVLSPESTEAHLEIFEVSGRKLVEKPIFLLRPETTFKIFETQAFPPGIYLVKLKLENKNFFLKVIKK